MSESFFDVVIIGAGIAGASLAAELASTHRVVVLEREEFAGYHSTGRSAALFSEIYGNSTVRALSRASRDFFFTPPNGFSPTALVKPRGSLYIAKDAQLPRLEQFASHEDVAQEIRRIEPADAIRLCPILKDSSVSGAALEEHAADVDVSALHQGYLRQFQAAGGVLWSQADAVSLSYKNGDWRIESSGRSFVAPIVINAAGAWAGDVAKRAGAAAVHIQPRRRTALLVELPQGVSAENWPMVIDIDETFYLKPDAGLLLISPADETPVGASDVQPEELDVAIAIDRIEQTTTLKIQKIRKRWAGLRSFAPDRSPVVGFDPVRQGFFWLAAQGGYGIQTAPALAKLAAHLIRKQRVPAVLATPQVVADLSPQRFVTAARSIA